MKKFLVVIACAMLSFGAANAQSSILSKLASAANSAASKSSNSTIQSLASVISSKLVPTSDQIVGTWSYQKPAVMFTSNNSLKSAAASLASAKLENTLQTKYLSKIGVTKGKMSMTFKSDKSFSVNRNGKTVATGTYTISGSDVTLTFTGKSKACKLVPQLDNGTLCLVGDVTKLKTFLEGVGSKVSSLSTLTSLSKSMSGMKIGIRMSK